MKYIILFVLLKFVFVTSLTCDFHLVEQYPEILQHLPVECQEISKDDELYRKMIAESLLFVEFQEKLTQYEIKKDESYIENTEEETIPNKDWELREKIYDEIMLYDCYSDDTNETGETVKTEKSYDEIIECLTAKRKIMIDTFPEAEIDNI